MTSMLSLDGVQREIDAAIVELCSRRRRAAAAEAPGHPPAATGG